MRYSATSNLPGKCRSPRSMSERHIDLGDGRVLTIETTSDREDGMFRTWSLKQADRSTLTLQSFPDGNISAGVSRNYKGERIGQGFHLVMGSGGVAQRFFCASTS